ncbi:MAG: tryptophan synthase subunit alpha [Ruminococcus sp.]|nr:tryptophan synthase subunit alpha [Ruminococcus sp.]
MSRIESAFKEKAFVAFLTAGDPSMEKSEEYIGRLIDGGADVIEIGIPFSDPIAEGPVIQSANVRALRNGANLSKVFELVKNVRKKYKETPIVFLTYLNPVYKYGAENFFKKCSEIGADGIIVPDMPFEERGEISEAAEKYGIDIVPLIAPTSEDRIKLISQVAQGYIYIVSSMGVTGMRSEIKTDIASIVETVRKYSDKPTAVGFGINKPEQATKYSAIADGVIVGSAIVKIIERLGENAGDELYNYAKEMKEACLKAE